MVSQTQDKGRVAGAAFLLFCGSLFLTAYTAKNPPIARLGHSVLGEVMRPLQMMTEGTHSRILGLWTGYVALQGVQSENEKYRARLATLESENAKLAEIKNENARLQKLLNVAAENSLSYVEGTVIAYDPSSFVQAVTINRGSVDGIAPGMAVVEGNGIVGQVVAVSLHTARVMLIIDRASSVDALIQSSRVRGIIEGKGRDKSEFVYVGESEEVMIGDKVVTSGLDGVFPKGLIVGVVTAVQKSANGLFKSIEVTPSVKFYRLESLLVVLPGKDNAREDVKEGVKTMREGKKRS